MSKSEFKAGLVSQEEYQAYLKRTGKRDIGEVLREQGEAQRDKIIKEQAEAKAKGLKDPIKSIQIQQGNIIVTQGVQTLLDDIKKVNTGIAKVDENLASLTLKTTTLESQYTALSEKVDIKYTSLSETCENRITQLEAKSYEDRIALLETNLKTQQETVTQFKPVYDLYTNVMGIINCSWCDCDCSHLLGENAILYASNNDIMSSL